MTASFFEVTVDVGGERRKVWKFLLRLMYSGRDCRGSSTAGPPPFGKATS